MRYGKRGKLFCHVEIIVGKITGIPFRCGGTGSHVNDRLEARIVEFSFVKKTAEQILFQIIREFETPQVLPFFRCSEMIDQQDIGLSRLIQCGNHGSADESRCSGYNVFHNFTTIRL